MRVRKGATVLAHGQSRVVGRYLLALGLALVFFGHARETHAGTAALAQSPGAGPEHVVLLHGLGRTERSMAWMGRRLGDAGYEIHNIRYPSREQQVEELAAGLAAQVEACCSAQGSTVHFVTHSMGGIVVRALLVVGANPHHKILTIS